MTHSSSTKIEPKTSPASNRITAQYHQELIAMLYFPHDFSMHITVCDGKSVRYPSPPAYGLACDLVAWVRRLAGHARRPSKATTGSPAREAMVIKASSHTTGPSER
ncbi:hypothetical protein IG197_31740 (plasmid) [Aminobacter sp. SR38]|jgi:hypothetical protein|uniref:hypothetical protein n=1 Tax=Aminobacter sp. SR38 TaxID=2774562 RepID=UPI0017821FE7|nr:hypothetical protein [Aminobacter sp. SR38]QOF75082.1 hypothetical protein IG197_31740 [Aminobacter sp. SR38]